MLYDLVNFCQDLIKKILGTSVANSIPGQNGKCVASPCIARSGGPGALCNDVEFFDVRPMPSSGTYYITCPHK